MPCRLGGRIDLASWSGMRVWVTGFLVFFGLAAAWALATPLTAVPDEPAHIVKAAATVRLEFRGVTVTQPTVVDNVRKDAEMAGFSVPAGYRQLLDMHDCYHADKHVPASCAAPIAAARGSVVVGTSAGPNNPTYYLLVGWPSLFAKGETGIYLMRLVSAAVCAAFLASAVWTVGSRRRHGGVLLVGLVAAATPTALFLNGSVNPNSVEVSAGITLWATALAVFMDPDPARTNARLNLAAIASAALVCVRPLGPLWIVGILACALLAGERGVLRSLAVKPLVWLWTAVLGTLTVAAFAWTAHYGVITTSDVNFPQWTFAKAASFIFDHTLQYVDSMVGLFGWLDVTPPSQTRLVWYVGLLMLGGLALLLGRWRERWALVALVVAIVAIPVVVQGKQAQHVGVIWQGRYLLAFAAGLPILATAVLAQNLDRRLSPLGDAAVTTSGAETSLQRATSRPATLAKAADLVRPAALVALTLFAADGVVMFYGALHRYAVGAAGPLFPAHPDWTPPGGLTPTVALYLLALAGLLAFVWAAVRQDRSFESSTPGDAGSVGGTPSGTTATRRPTPEVVQALAVTFASASAAAPPATAATSVVPPASAELSATPRP